MKTEQLETFKLSIYDVKDQLRSWVYRRSEEAFAAGDRARDEIRSKEQLEERVKAMRQAFLDAIGGLPSSDSPLNGRVTKTVSFDGYRVENIIFESRPGMFVTGNLYIPDGLSEPSAAVLFLCGHSDDGKQYDTYQSVCQRLVRAGLIVFAVDPIGQGERWSYYDPDAGRPLVPPSTRDHDQAGSQCIPLGDGLARYFVHDAMRAVDYLLTRPEVDPARIGVTGNSGGGTQTSMMMLCDPRIAAAAPGTFIMSRESYIYAGQPQDAEQIWRGATKLGLDHEDLLLAMAPRPVIVLAVTSDFFPIEGTRRTVARAKRFWEMFGKGDSLQLAEDRSTHRYTPELAAAAASFFSRHLLGKELSLEEARALPTVPCEPALLNCTESGQVLGDFRHARTVFDENKDRLAALEKARAETSEEERKSKALAWLRAKVCGGRLPVELNPRFLSLGKTGELETESYLWWSQERLFNHAFVFRHEKFKEDALPVTIGLWPRGTNRLSERMEWIQNECANGRAVLVLDVTGDGVLTPNAINPREIWDRFGTLHKLTTDLFWLDDSLAAIRAYDVLRALDAAAAIPGVAADSVHLLASGNFCIYAELAAALDGRIRKLVLEGGRGSVGEWVRERLYHEPDIVSYLLPGMLAYFDLPDLRRWSAAETVVNPSPQ